MRKTTLVAFLFLGCGFSPSTDSDNDDDDREDPVLECTEAAATCRASLDECDIEETCPDAASDCPADAIADDDTPCSVGSCQTGFCMPAGLLGAYWPLNGALADTALDSSINERDGTKLGEFAVVTGNFGDALHFNGTNSAIEIDDFDYGQSYTISLWFRAAATPDKRHVLLTHAAGSGVGSVEIAVERDGALTVLADDGAGGGVFGKSEKIAKDGNWHFVALRVGGGQASAFFDGALLGSAPIGMIDPAEPIMLGARKSLNPDSILEGELDDVRIYQQEVSTPDLVSLYIDGNGRTVRLRPVADSEVRGGSFSDVAQGTDNSMQVKVDNPDTTYHGLMRFDLTSITVPISSATLTLHVSYRGAVAGMENVVSELGSDDWDELTVTFDTMPAIGADVATWSVPLADTDQLVDLTALTQAELASDGVLSFAIRSTIDLGGEGYVGYNTRESNFIPTLTVELEP